MSLSLENQTARNTRLAELQTMLGEQNARAEQDRLIASPGTTEEVAAVLRWTTQHSLSVTPQGSGTKAGWLNAASADLTLSLLRLRSFQRASDNPQNVTVGAGIRWAQLQEQLRHAGQRLPLDAHRATDATVGGVLSTNDSGLLRLRHGAARELVTATTLVLADGTILRSDEQPTDALHPLARSYDLTQLLIGSFGTLAVLTEATLRTSPLSPPAATFTLRAPDALELAAVMKAILGASLPLERLQMRNESHAFALDVELATDTLKPEQERLEQLAGSLPCSLAQLPVWQSRSQALSTPNATVLRITALPAKLAPLVAGFAHLAQHPEYEFRAVADPTGIVTVSCQAPKETLLTLIDDLRARLASSGGTVTVLERGNLSEEVDRWALPPHVLEIMRSVKQEFDPKKILNPGRFAGGI
ncbi:MAG: FAD-binding oxidoreductase [Acidobacteriaceae bacterium]|nr:FAD-binding oxidoreductase [Acidobacteriaceae bacterium]